MFRGSRDAERQLALGPALSPSPCPASGTAGRRGRGQVSTPALKVRPVRGSNSLVIGTPVPLTAWLRLILE